MYKIIKAEKLNEIVYLMVVEALSCFYLLKTRCRCQNFLCHRHSHVSVPPVYIMLRANLFYPWYHEIEIFFIYCLLL